MQQRMWHTWVHITHLHAHSIIYGVYICSSHRPWRKGVVGCMLYSVVVWYVCLVPIHCSPSIDTIMTPLAVITLLSFSLLGVLMPSPFVSGSFVLSTSPPPGRGPPGRGPPGGETTPPLQMEDLTENLAVNQLAILQLLRKMAPGKYIFLYYICLIFFIKKYTPLPKRLVYSVLYCTVICTVL